MSRGARETRALENRLVIRANYALFVSVGIAFVVVIAPAYFHSLAPWNRFAPDVRIERQQWHVLADNGAACGEVAQGLCLAASARPELWQSPMTRADPEHARRELDFRGKDFWVGAEIPAARLRQAFSLGANQLLIGRFNALYRVWVDGELLARGIGRSEADPVILALPLSRLEADQPLRVAIQLHHQYEHTTPDLLNSTAGGEGLVTPANASALRGMLSFWSVARPFSLFTAYFIIAGIFAYVWLSARYAGEYYYMALHLMACALIQARLIDSLDLTVDTQSHYGLDFCLEVYRAGFCLFLGLAFARTRQSVFKIGMPLLVFAPLLVLALVPEALARQVAFNLARKWLTGPAYFVGGAVCLLQAWHLQTATRLGGAYLPVRVRRLVMFGVALGLVGASYSWFARGFALTPSASPGAFWTGSQDLLLVLFLAFLAAREYRHRAILVHQTPVSEYHRQPPLSGIVSGMLLVIDLKASEPFYRHRAGTGDARDLVSLWRWHLYACATEFGGLTIHKKGDEIAVLFDAEKCADPLLNALSASEKMAELSRQLTHDFTSQGVMPQESSGFRFRAALCPAELRPLWDQLGTSLEPSWEEAPGSRSDEEVGLLLKFEKKILGGAARTVIALPRHLLNQALALKPALADRILPVTGPRADESVAIELGRAA